MISEEMMVLEINPEPWAIGTSYVGRKNGGVRSGIAPNEKLVVYQNALKEELLRLWTKPMFYRDEELSVEFWFKRQVDEKDGKPADADNLQKATNDAMQGIVFKNDVSVKRVKTTIVEQSIYTEPAIFIRVGLWTPNQDYDSYFKMVLDHVKNERVATSTNEW